MQNNVWDGSGILPAVQMAFEHINNDNRLLQGYELQLLWNDSEVGLFYNLYHILNLIFINIHTFVFDANKLI